MEVLNNFFDLLKKKLRIERSGVMIDALSQVLLGLGEAETYNVASSDDAAVTGGDIRV